MSNFNWQTDEDVNWDDLEPVRNTAVSRRHPWMTYALIVVGVITAVALIYRQVNQRIETATANATGDILASHNLVQQASADLDVELFNTLLSGREPGWVEAQSELLRTGSLFDRSALDLVWQPPVDTAVTQADIDSGTVNIELNPELTTAELTVLQDYAVSVGNAVTETVQLQQTAVYRIGTQRWLYSPPDDEFWGEYESISGMILSLSYPVRDGELARRLAFDLDDKLIQMCGSLAELNCGDNFRLRLRLESDPQSLVDAARPVQSLRSGSQLTLPAPTLVGLPVDEAGYQALYRGYAIQLVSATVADLTNYFCCQHLAYFQALLAYQLDELGLRPFPQDRIDYNRVVRENTDFEELDGGWRSSDDWNGEMGWLAVTAVDYIRRQLPDISTTAMQRQMQASPRFVNWLAFITVQSSSFNRDSLGRNWSSFAFEQYLAQQEPPPLPLPEQDVYLLCSADQEAELAKLYQYRVANSELISHPHDGLALSLSPLPNDDAFLLLGAAEGEVLRSYLWQAGSIRSIWTDETITLGQFDPTGQYLLAYYLDELVISRVDWLACAAGDCLFEPLGGYPIWSPQGTDFIMLPENLLGETPFMVNGRTILFDPTLNPAESPIYRGSGQPPTTELEALTWVGLGYAPFWLDETTFGYIRQMPVSANGSGHELVLMNTVDELPRPILTEAELQQALPDNLNAAPILRYVVPHPSQPDLLFIAAAVFNREMLIFSYNLQTDTLQYRLKTGLVDNHSLSFSPDGRFLVITGTNDESQLFEFRRSDIYLYDLETEQVQIYAGTNPGFAPANVYDWSDDGQWLVITQNNQTMTLAAPAYNYQQFIPHGRNNCTNVAWLNQ